MSEFDVDICVVTYKRPWQLAELIASLAKQELNGFSFRIVVVDNDKNGSGRQIVENQKSLSGIEIIYALEPQQGISFARNKALTLATAPFIAFIDDDETAPPDWLSLMWKAIHQYEADVVFGPVAGNLPETAPAWTKTHPSFCRTTRPSGTESSHGASGNVLIRATALGVPRQEFSTAYALSGGEDTEFFLRLSLAGSRMVWCDEAEVQESIPIERTSIGWVIRRSFRSGQTYYRIVIARGSLLSRFLWFPKKVGHLLVAIISLPILAVVSFPNFVKMLCKACAVLGQLSGVLGPRFIYAEYSAKRYNPDNQTKKGMH